MSKYSDGYIPSWTEVLFAAWLALLLGGLLACVVLITKPVTEVKALPRESDRLPGVVYYVPGNVDSVRGRGWLEKRKQFLQGLTIELSSEELNAAMGKVPPPPAPKEAPKPLKKGEAPPPPPPPPEPPSFDLGSPNFSIVGDQLQMSVPLHSPAYGITVVVQTTGRYERRGEGFTFVPERTCIGSMPLHMIPNAQSYVLEQAMSRVPKPEELVAAWSRLADVRIENGKLRLVAP
jgi:hypothetical protein